MGGVHPREWKRLSKRVIMYTDINRYLPIIFEISVVTNDYCHK